MQIVGTLARLPIRVVLTLVRSSRRALPVAAGERRRLDPTGLGLRALRAMASAASRSADPADGWKELHNKVEAFVGFRSTAAAPHSSARADVFADLWRREGLGYLRGRELAQRGRERPAANRAPRELLPLHTGLGLGLASARFEPLGRRPTAAALGGAIDGFLDDCRQVSLPGYRGAVVEALGLRVYLSHRRQLRAVDQELRGRRSAERSLFWHGVGRGLYFDPREMVPASAESWGSLRRALDLAGDPDARRNAIAGVAWAATLVNIRHPEVLATRLTLELPGVAAGDEEAIAHGVSCAVLLWLDAVGEETILKRFLSFRPRGAVARSRWRQRVGEPVRKAMERIYPPLSARCGLGELFRFQPPGDDAESSPAAHRGDGAPALHQ